MVRVKLLSSFSSKTEKTLTSLAPLALESFVGVMTCLDNGMIDRCSAKDVLNVARLHGVPYCGKKQTKESVFVNLRGIDLFQPFFSSLENPVRGVSLDKDELANDLSVLLPSEGVVDSVLVLQSSSSREQSCSTTVGASYNFSESAEQNADCSFQYIVSPSSPRLSIEAADQTLLPLPDVRANSFHENANNTTPETALSETDLMNKTKGIRLGITYPCLEECAIPPEAANRRHTSPTNMSSMRTGNEPLLKIVNDQDVACINRRISSLSNVSRETPFLNLPLPAADSCRSKLNGLEIVCFSEVPAKRVKKTVTMMKELADDTSRTGSESQDGTSAMSSGFSSMNKEKKPLPKCVENDMDENRSTGRSSLPLDVAEQDVLKAFPLNDDCGSNLLDLERKGQSANGLETSEPQLGVEAERVEQTVMRDESFVDGSGIDTARQECISAMQTDTPSTTEQLLMNVDNKDSNVTEKAFLLNILPHTDASGTLDDRSKRQFGDVLDSVGSPEAAAKRVKQTTSNEVSVQYDSRTDCEIHASSTIQTVFSSTDKGKPLSNTADYKDENDCMKERSLLRDVDEHTSTVKVLHDSDAFGSELLNLWRKRHEPEPLLTEALEPSNL